MSSEWSGLTAFTRMVYNSYNVPNTGACGARDRAIDQAA